MKLMVILSLYFISFIVQSKAQTAARVPWCQSCNDPHMVTLDGQPYEFQIPGKNYIMYTNYFDTRVTASFQKCNANKNVPICNCGINVNFKGDSLFLDACDVVPKAGLQFFYNARFSSNPVPAGCDGKQVPAGKETDDTWWNQAGNAVAVGTKFLCAKSKAQASVYYIRTNSSDNNKNIYVKVQLHCRGITCIFIKAAQFDFGNTGGLCGNFSNNKGDDLFIWKCTGTPDGTINGGYSPVKATAQQMSQFWKLDGCAPDELQYKQLSRDVCLCDKETPISDCKTPIAVCVAKLTGHDHLPSPCGCVHNQDAISSNRQDAADHCDKHFNFFNLHEAVKAKLLDDDFHANLREWCILDFIDASDFYWTIHTIQIGRNRVLENCGGSNNHPLCSEFLIPCKCLISDYRLIVNDREPIERCPTRDTCPPPTCPLIVPK